MTNEEAIKQLEITKQCDVDTVAQIKALNMAIVALRNYPISEPLTLEQLRKMDGQPVYCGERKEWGVIHIDPDGPWANVPFFRGVYCDLDVQHNGLTLYAYQPAHIDQEEWEPCGLCKSCGNCTEAGKATGEKINYAHPCHSCLNGDNFKPVEFCRYCGRPLTEEAWAELEKRMEVKR